MIVGSTAAPAPVTKAATAVSSSQAGGAPSAPATGEEQSSFGQMLAREERTTISAPADQSPVHHGHKADEPTKDTGGNGQVVSLAAALLAARPTGIRVFTSLLPHGKENQPGAMSVKGVTAQMPAGSNHPLVPLATMPTTSDAEIGPRPLADTSLKSGSIQTGAASPASGTGSRPQSLALASVTPEQRSQHGGGVGVLASQRLALGSVTPAPPAIGEELPPGLADLASPIEKVAARIAPAGTPDDPAGPAHAATTRRSARLAAALPDPAATALDAGPHPATALAPMHAAQHTSIKTGDPIRATEAGGAARMMNAGGSGGVADAAQPVPLAASAEHALSRVEAVHLAPPSTAIIAPQGNRPATGSREQVVGAARQATASSLTLTSLAASEVAPAIQPAHPASIKPATFGTDSHSAGQKDAASPQPTAPARPAASTPSTVSIGPDLTGSAHTAPAAISPAPNHLQAIHQEGPTTSQGQQQTPALVSQVAQPAPATAQAASLGSSQGHSGAQTPVQPAAPLSGPTPAPSAPPSLPTAATQPAATQSGPDHSHHHEAGSPTQQSATPAIQTWAPGPVSTVPRQAPAATAAHPEAGHRGAAVVQPIAQGLVVRQASLRQVGDTSSFRAVLTPRSLGEVTVHVTRGQEGLQVTITSQQASTQALLNRHLPDLLGMLKATGQDLPVQAQVVTTFAALPTHHGTPEAAAAGQSGLNLTNSGGQQLSGQQFSGQQPQAEQRAWTGMARELFADPSRVDPVVAPVSLGSAAHAIAGPARIDVHA